MLVVVTSYFITLCVCMQRSFRRRLLILYGYGLRQEESQHVLLETQIGLLPELNANNCTSLTVPSQVGVMQINIKARKHRHANVVQRKHLFIESTIATLDPDEFSWKLSLVPS